MNNPDITAAVTCCVLGAIGASLASWRKKVTILQTLFALCFGTFVAAVFGVMVLFGALPMSVAIPASAGAGLMVFGVVSWFEKTEQKIPDLTPQQLRDFLLRRQIEESK